MPAQRGHGAKKSAFSCERCRNRKVKCGGEQPACGRCASRNEACEYKLNPTLSYTQRLENRVRELESLLKAQDPTSWSGRTLPPIQTFPSLSSPSVDAQSTKTDRPDSQNQLPSLKDIEALKVNLNGQTSYHGPTSLLHLSIFDSHGKAQEPIEQRVAQSLEMERKQRLRVNAWQQRALEVFSNTPEHFQYLLDFHYAWIQPLFNFIYRPLFTRDMDLLGPYYSHALLSAILAHSARWCQSDPNISDALAPYENGAVFFRQATALLHENLRDGKCDIPTIQTCLLISAQYCSKGNWTCAWMYSGIAFRLVEDLGINIDGRKYASTINLSEEDIEMRNRLFWSCYFWDKIISLYLGRCPVIQFSNVAPPNDMMEDTTETELWIPHGVRMSDGTDYPATQAHSISSFTWICKLSEILNQLLMQVYNPLNETTEAEVLECINKQQAALRHWWRELPSHLRIIQPSLPDYCPPSHIVTLNCLYHTVKILAHRPVLSKNLARATVTGRDAIIECVAAASSITMVFELFIKTFGLDHCVMALSYCLYMASSVFLLYIQATKSTDPKVMQQLRFCTDALEKVSTTNAVLQSALQIIYAEMERANINVGPRTRFEWSQSISHSPLIPDIPPSRKVPFVDSSVSANVDFDRGNAFKDESEHAQWGELSLDNVILTPGVLETFSQLEPISTSVGREMTQAGSI